MLKTNKAFYCFSFCIFSMLISSALLAQETDILMTNSRQVDEERYKGVKGNPYLFKEWRKGKIISVNADAIEEVLLNFNGETKGFEIKKGNSFIELDPKWYIRVVVMGETPDQSIIFQKNFSPPLANEFTRVVYEGTNFNVVEHFISKIEVKIINNVGKNEELKKFYSKRNYYLIKDKKPTLLKLKKKSLFTFLGHKSVLDSFAKKEKLKLSSEADLIKLFTFYEESGFAE